MTVWDPPGHGLDIYQGDRLPEIMAVIPPGGTGTASQHRLVAACQPVPFVAVCNHPLPGS